MRYQDLLLSAVNNAMRGVLPEQSAAIDAIGIADTLFPTVSQGVCEAAAADPSRRDLVRRQKSITLVTGAATLTSDVLVHYIQDSVLLDTANLSKRYAWRDYPDFVRRGDRRLGIYTVVGAHELQVIDPNQPFTVPLTASGARVLTIPCVVEKPTLATDQVDCTDEILSDLDEALANSLRGMIIKEAGVAA